MTERAPCMHPPCSRERATDQLTIRTDHGVTPPLTVRVCERCRRRARYTTTDPDPRRAHVAAALGQTGETA